MIKEEYSSYYKEDNSKREENSNHIDNNISSMEEQTYKEESIASRIRRGKNRRTNNI